MTTTTLETFVVRWNDAIGAAPLARLAAGELLAERTPGGIQARVHPTADLTLTLGDDDAVTNASLMVAAYGDREDATNALHRTAREALVAATSDLGMDDPRTGTLVAELVRRGSEPGQAGMAHYEARGTTYYFDRQPITQEHSAETFAADLDAGRSTDG